MKIQVLELPMEHVGEYSTTPYALIGSEIPEDYVARWGEALAAIEGPAWTMATNDEVVL